MSKRLEVLDAIKALVTIALPAAAVLGMDAGDAKPERVGPHGLAIVRSGDPGPAEIDLSPPVYHYEHTIPIELAGYPTPADTAQVVLDRMMTAIGLGIAADRTLGGLCDWLDVEAPTDGEIDARGAVPIGWADFNIIAAYSTTSPLG